MANSFDRKALHHVAELASLTLTDDEAEALATDMQRILAYVDELATVDTTDVEPTAIVTLTPSSPNEVLTPKRASALRADEPRPSLDRQEVLAQAPRANEQGFLVPTFVESGS